MHAQDEPSNVARFEFVGDAIALDLVNTEVVMRGRPHDLLAAPAELAAWWAAAQQRYPETASIVADGRTDCDSTMLAQVVRLRSALRSIFTALAEGRSVDGTDLTTVNDVLRHGYPTVEASSGASFRARYGISDEGTCAPLLVSALSARDLLTSANRERLHKCANERCVLLFYDTTRSGTRRWCSTACMNRARSIARYRERVARKSEPDILSGQDGPASNG